jgi:hypothetical protein
MSWAEIGLTNENFQLRERIRLLEEALSRLTATDPVMTFGHTYCEDQDTICVYCDADNDKTTPSHKPDCPWVAARSLLEAK